MCASDFYFPYVLSSGRPFGQRRLYRHMMMNLPKGHVPRRKELPWSWIEIRGVSHCVGKMERMSACMCQAIMKAVYFSVV